MPGSPKGAVIWKRNAGISSTLLVAEPADLAAVDRLARLAENAGQPARVEELRRRKAQIERLRARDEKLYQRNQPIRDAEEMSTWPNSSAGRFEARGFLILARSNP